MIESTLLNVNSTFIQWKDAALEDPVPDRNELLGPRTPYIPQKQKDENASYIEVTKN